MTKKRTSKKGKFYKDFYLQGDLEEQELLNIETILRKDVINSVKNVINESAKDFNRTYVETTLRDPQTLPVAMSWYNKRIFIGDKPGLGKTVMSTASYSLYRMQMKKEGKPVGKLLLVTDTNHCIGMSVEMRKRFGVNLLPLIKGTDNINRQLKKVDFANDDSFDGVVTNWGSLKSNGFLMFYLDHAEMFGMAILDETSNVKNKKTKLYQVTNDILNNFNGGIERAIFLNASAFEKNIYDLYNQFLLLSPRLFPSKKFIDDNYVVTSGKSYWLNDMAMVNGEAKFVKREQKRGEIVDYKNQEELKSRIRHHYIARSKKDYSKVLPSMNYRLYPSYLSKEQVKMLVNDDVVKNASLLNSPTTRDKNAKFTEATVPKFADVLNHFETVVEDRPIIYVYNTEAQLMFKKALMERGYKVEILNGKETPERKQEIQDQFNNKELDTLIFNIERAINLPTSDRIIFYDIPTMPQRTYQINGRIDRDNYTQPKFYDYFVYVGTLELFNMVLLSRFREKHASAFTGQEENLYEQLIEQIDSIIDTNKLTDLQNYIDQVQLEDSNYCREVVDVLKTIEL